MDKKRLTIEEMGEQIRCYVPYGECNDCDKCDHADKIRRKLAAYERACDDPIKVAEWAKADAEGRLAVFPEKAVCPHELSKRFWVCGWDLYDYTWIIHDRKWEADDESAIAAEGGQGEA